MAKSSFFKVFFPDQSSNRLRIPPAFREHIEAETSKNLSLKGPSGSRWRVGLVKNSDGLFFEDGWEEFVTDQCLAIGDFLVFQYHGNSRFSVSIFDTTACEKKAAFLARPSGGDVVDVEEEPEVVIKEEIVEEEEPFIDHLPLSELVRMKKKRRSQSDSNWSKLNTSIWSLSGKTAHLNSGSSALANDCMSQSKPKSKRGRPRKNSGESMEFKNVNRFNGLIGKAKLEFGSNQDSTSSLHFRETSPSKKPKKEWQLVKCNKVSGERGDNVKVLRTGKLISQRRPVTKEEVDMTLQKAMLFTSTNPFALAVMQEAYVYSSFFMSIPAWFAAKHLPKENTNMTVWDPSGRSWTITYISKVSRGALSGGWGKFSYTNNLEKYDVCIFELIETTHLRVHIFRVVDEITPLLRFRNYNS